MDDGFIEGLSPNAIKGLQNFNAELVKIISNVNIIGIQLKAINTPSGASSGIGKVNSELEAQRKVIANLTAQLATLSNQRKANNYQTTEEIVNQNILNRSARQAAVINSTLAGAYAKLSAAQAKSATNVQNIIARGRLATQTQRQYNNELKVAQREFDKLNAKVLLADKAVGRFNRNVGNYPMLARGFGDLLGAFGIIGGVTAIAAIMKSIFDITRELQSMNLALTQVVGNSQEAARAQSFLAKIADDYGIKIQVLTKSYTGFWAASKNAMESGIITGREINAIFESVSKAAGAMGLSVEQQEGAFLALSQMISKGNIQAEELRGQLSERLPGAFGILAKSMGVTEVELNKLLKDGKVIAAEVLPAFAKELERAYGVEGLRKVETLNAAVTRLGNTWTSFVGTLNGDGGFAQFISAVVAGFANILEGLGYLASSAEQKQKESWQRARSDGYRMEKEYREQVDKLREEEIKNLKEQGEEGIAYAKNLEKEYESLRNQEIAGVKEYNKRKATEINVRLAQLRIEREEIEKNTSTAKIGRGLSDREFQMERNRKEQERLNISLSSYYGQIEAANELLSEGTKETKKNTEAMAENAAVLAAKIRYLKALTDASRAVYEEEKLRRELEIAEIEKFATDEKRSFQDRIESYGEMLKKREELATFTFDYERAQVAKQREVDLEEARKSEEAGVKSVKSSKESAEQKASEIAKIQAYYAKERVQINKKFDAIDLKNQEQYQADYLKIVEETSKAEQEIINHRREVLASTEKEYRDSQLQIFKDVADNEKLSVQVRQEAFRSYIALKQKQIDIDKAAAIAAAGNNQEEIDLIKARYAEIQRLLNSESSTESPLAKSLADANAELERMKENLMSDQFAGAGLSKLKTLFDGTFKSIIDGFDQIENENERFLKKFQYTFETIASIASEAFSFMQENSNKYFEGQISRLEQQRDIALAFEGQSAEGRAEIERQFDERRRAIQKRQAQSDKKMAEFKIVVDTARAFTAALPNIPLAFVMAALGAVQLGIVAAQPLPQFKDGGIHEGGFMMVNDEKGKRYREAVRTPDGKVTIPKGRNVIMKAPKGTEIFNATETEQMFSDNLNRLLYGNGITSIAPTFASAEFKNQGNSGMTKDDMRAVMMETLGSQPQGNVYEQIFDENGVSKYIRKGNQRIEQLNNVLRLQGQTISRR